MVRLSELFCTYTRESKSNIDKEDRCRPGGQEMPVDGVDVHRVDVLAVPGQDHVALVGELDVVQLVHRRSERARKDGADVHSLTHGVYVYAAVL